MKRPRRPQFLAVLVVSTTQETSTNSHRLTLSKLSKMRDQHNEARSVQASAFGRRINLRSAGSERRLRSLHRSDEAGVGE
jgi:hypothetical protein